MLPIPSLHPRAEAESTPGNPKNRRKSDQGLEALFNSSAYLIGALSQNGVLQRINPAWSRLIGWPSEKLLSVPSFEFVHGKDSELFRDQLIKIAAGEPTQPFEARLICENGAEKWFRWSGILSEQENLVFVIGADITEHKEIEDKLRESENALLESEKQLTALNLNLEREIAARSEALRRKEEELLQSQKMEAIGRLAGGVAHDFNNLLTGIVGIAEDLKQSLPEDDPRRAEATEITQASERAFELTRQLLAFARKQTTQPRVIDLNQCVQGLHKLLRRLLGEDVEISLHLGKIHPVRIDPLQIEQILVNLCVNARDAMPDGGAIALKTAPVLLDGNGQDSSFLEPGRYIKMEISDTGCGMDEETLAHIFEPFFTTKEKGQGTGLGLSTVYGIVSQSGGKIYTSSKPGAGTTFTIYFPAAIGPVDSDIHERAPSHFRGHCTVLVVEDDDIVRRAIVHKLHGSGYHVLEASEGGQAIALIESGQHADLIVTDVVMPGMNGRDLAEKVQRIVPKVKVLFMSGYPEEIIAERGVVPQGINFIDKSTIHTDLINKIQAIL